VPAVWRSRPPRGRRALARRRRPRCAGRPHTAPVSSGGAAAAPTGLRARPGQPGRPRGGALCALSRQSRGETGVRGQVPGRGGVGGGWPPPAPRPAPPPGQGARHAPAPPPPLAPWTPAQPPGVAPPRAPGGRAERSRSLPARQHAAPAPRAAPRPAAPNCNRRARSPSYRDAEASRHRARASTRALRDAHPLGPAPAPRPPAPPRRPRSPGDAAPPPPEARGRAPGAPAAGMSASAAAPRARKRAHPTARIKGGWTGAEDAELTRCAAGTSRPARCRRPGPRAARRAPPGGAG
jgi:hypothetical protein